MKIQFIGATHEVTGSCTLLEVCGKKYLVDCGMEQGQDVFENIPIPVPVKDIEAVFLTHAHIDHSGMLPKLCKDGFRGPIYATESTCDLCTIMLQDSAHIQEFEAEWRNRKAQRADQKLVEPVYSMADAMQAISQFRRCRYSECMEVAEGIVLRFSDIGHLLGSACIELWLTEQGKTHKIVFSGDVGNKNQPLIKDPQPVEETEYLVIESTYGDRLHDAEKPALEELAEILQKTLDRGGNVVSPSFAVGRTQELLYAIRQIKVRHMLHGHDRFPVYVDSPLAVEATGIYLQCDNSCLDEETMELVNQGINPIWFDGITLSVTSEESKAINFNQEPKVILSASGMCEAGRIRHHLKHNLWNRNNTILFVGYQAEGSLGRRLQEGIDSVKLFGEEVACNAEIATLHGTSGHADQAGLLEWLGGFHEKPRHVFINHGEDSSCTAFRDLLRQKGYQADAPYSGTEFDLTTDRMTIYTDGKLVSREQIRKETARNQMVFDELLSAAESLLSLVHHFRGRTNKDTAKFTAQIRNLVQKWR